MLTETASEICNNVTQHRSLPPSIIDSTKSFDRYLGIAPVKAYDRAQMLFGEGAVCEKVFQVIKGAVKLFKMTCDGRLQIIGFALPGDFVGLQNDGVHSLSAEATMRSQLRVWPRAHLDRLIHTDRTIATQLWEASIRAIRMIENQILMISRMEVLYRLASFLVYLSERQSESTNDSDILKLPMTRRDISDYLGTTPETVSRCLSRLRDLGIISIPGTFEIIIHDMQALRDLGQ